MALSQIVLNFQGTDRSPARALPEPLGMGAGTPRKGPQDLLESRVTAAAPPVSGWNRQTGGDRPGGPLPPCQQRGRWDVLEPLLGPGSGKRGPQRHWAELPPLPARRPQAPGSEAPPSAWGGLKGLWAVSDSCLC